MRRTRLVIADRYPVVLQGLTSLFAAQYDFKIVASCSDGTSCIEAMRNLAPDVAILDVSMPNLTGLEILAIAIAENLYTRLVFFTASGEHRELVAATAAGACSVIPKDATPEILVQSLREVADDWRLLPLLRSPMLRSELVLSREERNAAVPENVLAVLTDREREIMRLVSEGLSNKAIARRLNISHGTIKVHLHHMYQKLEIHNRTVLAALAITQQ
jgi:RNA polymerase sigma factor (sigma-70 family)